jgi:hypothetical protein
MPAGHFLCLLAEVPSLLNQTIVQHVELFKATAYLHGATPGEALHQISSGKQSESEICS